MISFVPSLITFLGQTAGVLLSSRTSVLSMVKQMSVCAFQVQLSNIPKRNKNLVCILTLVIALGRSYDKDKLWDTEITSHFSLSFSQSKMKHLEFVVSRVELFIKLMNEEKALINASGIIHPNLSQHVNGL